MWLDVAVGLGAALLAGWAVLVVAVVFARPKGPLLAEALRIGPDLLRLLRRLATDRALPRGVRARLTMLLIYLASPIDLIPDFIPVLGYADDVIIVTIVLRGVVRRAGWSAVERQWPGKPGRPGSTAPSDRTQHHGQAVDTVRHPIEVRLLGCRC